MIIERTSEKELIEKLKFLGIGNDFIYNDQLYGGYYHFNRLIDQLIKMEALEEAVDVGKLYYYQNDKEQTAFIVLSEAYRKAGLIKEAIDAYKNAFRIYPKPKAMLLSYYAKTAESYYSKKKVIETYESILNRGSYYSTYKNYILYLLEEKEYTLSKEISLKALEIYKKQPTFFYLSLAKAYENLNKLDSSRTTLLKLISKKPNNVEAWRLLNRIENNLDKDESKITRTIEFAPEYHASGISILQNFGKLLRDKYIDTPVKVTISQEKLKVKMTIIPPDGKKVEVEDYLHKYGLVVKGIMQPEELISEPLQLMELKTELHMAKSRIELQREQMQFLSNERESEIKTLKEQVNWLRSQVGNSLIFQQENISELIDTFNNSKNIEKLVECINSNDLAGLKSIIPEIEKNSPEDYNKLRDFISNTVSSTSTSANAPAWIDFLSRALPI